MTVRFNGLKLMDSNCYDSIIIREKNGFQIDMKMNSQEVDNQLSYFLFQGQPISEKNSTQLQNKPDEEKVVEVVKKYLEYSQIYGVTNTYHLSHYKGWFSKISGSRDLYMQLYNPKLKIVNQMILKKYLEDRLRFCSNNSNINSYQIIINDYATSYDISEDYISLNLLSKDNNVINFEQEFLKDLIFNKLYEQGEIAEILYINSRNQFDENIKNYGYYIICGNLSINLIGSDTQINNLLKQIESYLYKYNQEVKNNKMMQLKIEGF